MNTDSVTITQKTYSLHELLLSIQSVIARNYGVKQYWIRCEVSRISLHAQSGHCYLELIDRNETSIVAQLKAMIWSDKYAGLCRKFEKVTQTPIANGMKLLLSCSVNFHPLHGPSLSVHDIEPSFTLGEMARMKNNSISRLKSEGIYTLNKTKSLPLVPARIAVISVATSRGYQDFITTIVHYQRKYAIRHTLFEAILQGDNAIPSLTRAIKRVSAMKDQFDAIAIIRGGAGDAGLSCYDEFSIAELIARSPLPIITGIGHATNETVSEMVAFKNCITPTAAASFIIDRFESLYADLSNKILQLKESVLQTCRNSEAAAHNATERICMLVRNKMDYSKFTLVHAQSTLGPHTARYLSAHQQDISQNVQVIFNVRRYGVYQFVLSQLNTRLNSMLLNTQLIFNSRREKLSQKSAIITTVQHQVTTRQNAINHLSEKVALLDPVNTLKRGYSITRLNGKALTEPAEAVKDSVLETQLAGGIITSTVNN